MIWNMIWNMNKLLSANEKKNLHFVKCGRRQDSEQEPQFYDTSSSLYYLKFFTINFIKCGLCTASSIHDFFKS